MEPEILYAYKNATGIYLHTTNLEFARIRADKLGTYDVYIVKRSD